MKIRILEFIYLLFLIVATYWLYILPFILNNHLYYMLLGGADDSTYGIFAQRAIDNGLQGAYSLTFAPFFPILMALVHTLFGFSIEKAGLIISSVSIGLTIFTVYFLTKILFDRITAVIASSIILIYPMSKIVVGVVRPQALQTLMMTLGILLSVLALKTNRNIYYFFAGIFWGLAYLTRFESWLPCLVLILFILLSICDKKYLKNILFNIFFVILGFLIITFSYLSYVHQVYGAWSLNPRINIDAMGYIGSFSALKGSQELTTYGQILMFPDERYVYKSEIWHPEFKRWLKALGRSATLDTPVPMYYLNILLSYSPGIVLIGFAGLITSLILIFKKRLRFLIVIILSLVFLYFFINTILRTFTWLKLENNLIISELLEILKTKITSKSPDPLLIKYFIGTIFTFFILFKNRKNFGKEIIEFLFKNRVLLYIPASLLICFIPLILHDTEKWYVVWIWPILAVYFGFLIILLLNFLKMLLKKINISVFIYFPIQILLIIIIMFTIISRNYSTFKEVRNTIFSLTKSQYATESEKISQMILKDHGRGAKVTVFETTLAFYVQGEPFFFLNDPTYSFNQVLNYYYTNNVDYIFLNASYGVKNLEPLLNPKIKLINWELLYAKPSINTNIIISNEENKYTFVIWKRKK